jgi:hypothetical protein
MPILFIGIPGGNGRCSRCAARRSAGDSNATTGAPKERPMREDSAPPSYSKINVRNHKLYDRSKRKSAYGMTRQPDTGIWVHEGNVVIKILFRRGVKVTRANQNDHNTCRFRQTKTDGSNSGIYALPYQRLFQTGLFALVPSSVTITHGRPGEIYASATARKKEVVLWRDCTTCSQMRDLSVEV